MKKLSLIAIIAVFIQFIPLTVQAQEAWHRKAKVFAFGIGGANYIHFWNNDLCPGCSGTFGNTNGLLSIQGEFGVHDYVGVGFTTGIGFARSEVNFPIGAMGNFHFYKLIDDKTSSDIHSSKLDIYAGLSVGTGVSIISSDAYAMLFVGPQIGIRYYFSEMLGVYFESGYGKSWVNGGIVLKVN